MTLNTLQRILVRQHLGIQLEAIAILGVGQHRFESGEARELGEAARHLEADHPPVARKRERTHEAANELNEHRARILDDAAKLGKVATNVALTERAPA